MLILWKKDGEGVLIQKDEQLGKGPPDSQAEREEVYERIRACVHEQDQPCSAQRERRRS